MFQEPSALASSQTTERIDSPATSQQLQQLSQQSQDPSQSPWDALFARLKDKPHDPEGWKKLVDLAEAPGPHGVVQLDRVKTTYDRLLETYPNTVCDDPKL